MTSKPFVSASDTHPVSGEFFPKVLVNQILTLPLFDLISGSLADYRFLKVVFDRQTGTPHFLNHAIYPYHLDYIGQCLKGWSYQELSQQREELTRSVYHEPNRRYFLGILCVKILEESPVFTLETSELDTLSAPLFEEFYTRLSEFIDKSIPVFLKPATHLQELFLREFDPKKIPSVENRELHRTA